MGGGGGETQAEATIYFLVWWVLFEYSSFEHFPYSNCTTVLNVKEFLFRVAGVFYLCTN